VLPTFLRAGVLGFSVAAPVGPVGILCIRRTLAEGRAVLVLPRGSPHARDRRGPVG